MEKKTEALFEKFKVICGNFHAHPVVLFARGKTDNGRGALLMLAGPTFTLESLNELRAEIKECLDEREKSLKGESGPDTAHVFY